MKSKTYLGFQKLGCHSKILGCHFDTLKRLKKTLYFMIEFFRSEGFANTSCIVRVDRLHVWWIDGIFWR